MYGENVTFAQAAVVCIFSMVVVFLVLLSISYMIDIIAHFINRKPKETASHAAAAPTVQAAAPAQDSHIDVVLVTAAVAAYLGKRTDEIVVHSIRKIGTEETAWSRAGRLDSLQ